MGAQRGDERPALAGLTKSSFIVFYCLKGFEREFGSTDPDNPTGGLNA